jgi:hypothetical protein
VGERDFAEWFGEYLEVYAACGRGEGEPRDLLAYWGVPLLLTTDDGFGALANEEQVLAVIGHQMEGLKSSGFHRIEILESETTVLNAKTALHRGNFVRRGRDDSEIARLACTFLLTDGADGRRISALVVHGG